MRELTPRILIADDEKDICDILKRLVQQEGYKAFTAHDGESALKMVRSELPDVLLTDFQMPGIDGMELLNKVKEVDPDLPVIMITAYADISGAVEALRAGAHDYLAKPFDHHEVIRVLQRALAESRLKRKLKNMETQLEDSLSLNKVMGPSDTIGRLIADVNRVAKSDFTVVIWGETGSGKELVARAIHHTSLRAGGPFIALDCGAIPETLITSELFGHEKGAFTGAVNKTVGKFQAANGGTLFLDEITNMPISSQVTLLRALQEKKVCAVGGVRSADINVRLLAASNQDLEDAVKAKTFRKDLFYRMNEFTIRIPPLRERKEDIVYLANRFLANTNIELGKGVEGFSKEAMDALLTYHWPGNVRQFRSTVRRAVLLADDLITEKHLDMREDHSSDLPKSMETNDMVLGEKSLKDIVRENTIKIEREVLIDALKHTGGNKAKAARLLQIDYKTIHSKVKQLGISTE